MELNPLQNWRWQAACSIRGESDAARYKDYILPLLFYKRLDDVYTDELTNFAHGIGLDNATAQAILDADRTLVRFYLPAHMRWSELRGYTTGLGARLTDKLHAIASENPKLVGVIDRRDFNATEQGQRVLEEDTLARLTAILSEQRLGLADVQPDLLGRAYEYLIRKFAERGSSAGEFFTPTEVGFLIAYILDPIAGDSFYDPTSGSGGLLIKAQLRHRAKRAAALGLPVADLPAEAIGRPIRLYGQELQGDNVAAAKMNAFLHDMDADVRQGNTMRNPNSVKVLLQNLF